MTPRIWEALLYQAPYINLLRNLRNFAKNGVFNKPKNLEYATRKLINGISEAKIYPFRLLSAYRELKLSEMDYNIRMELLKALEIAIERSIDNVPFLDGSVAIMSDVSGSMTSFVLSEKSRIRCIDIVGLFSAILLRRSNDVILLPFNDSVNFRLVNRIRNKERILDIASQFVAGGGTSLSAPINYLLKNNIKVDYIIGITDEEEWVGTRFINALNEYIQKVNPEVKVWLITLLPYYDYPVPKEIENVVFLYGWNEKILDFLGKTWEEFIEEIKKVKI